MDFKNKFFLGLLGCLLITVYAVLIVVFEFAITGLLEEGVVQIIVALILGIGVILLGIGTFEHYSDNKKIEVKTELLFVYHFFFPFSYFLK